MFLGGGCTLHMLDHQGRYTEVINCNKKVSLRWIPTWVSVSICWEMLVTVIGGVRGWKIGAQGEDVRGSTIMRSLGVERLEYWFPKSQVWNVWQLKLISCPMGAGHCQWGLLTDWNICNIHACRHLAFHDALDQNSGPCVQLAVATHRRKES